MTKFKVVYKQEKSLVSMAVDISDPELIYKLCMSYTYAPPQSANVQMTTALILHIKQGQRFTQ